jgi:hypothetical protein
MFKRAFKKQDPNYIDFKNSKNLSKGNFLEENISQFSKIKIMCVKLFFCDPKGFGHSFLA